MPFSPLGYFGILGALVALFPDRVRDSQLFLQKVVRFPWVPFRSWMFRPSYVLLVRVQGILAFLAAVLSLQWYLRHCLALV